MSVLSTLLHHVDTAPASDSGFLAFKTFTNSDLQKVNKLILEKLHSSVPLIPEVANHLIQTGGKRVRPCLTLAATKLFSETEHRQIGLATAVEFIHTATLLHDDVVDESELRRGQATANTIFGNKSSVLVGDFLFSRAFELMVDDGSMQTLKSLARASSIIAEGEVLQLATTCNLETTEDDYIKVISYKTGELFAAAANVAGLICDRSEAEVKALYDYGLSLGIAFQVIDDILDYSAKQQELGKTIGNDFSECKMTLPVIHAYQNATTSDEKAFWTRCVENKIQNPADFNQALSYIQKNKSLDYAFDKAEQYGKIALQALKSLPQNQANGILRDLIHFVLNRGY